MRRGLVEQRFLHADPNFANYAFLEDGRLIVYDHGCVKRVPEVTFGTFGKAALWAEWRAGAHLLQVEQGVDGRSSKTSPLRTSFSSLNSVLGYHGLAKGTAYRWITMSYAPRGRATP